jgi:YD repeat-containing protein
VVSWIDIDTGGIVHAEAYDAAGRRLKRFEPKALKKVNGQWQLQEMVIRNLKTGSRTTIEFELEQP